MTAMTAPRPVRLSRRGPVLVATLARPDRDNTIDAAVLAALSDALDAAERDPDCRMVVIDAEGDTFCAGMDFQEAAVEEPGTGSAESGGSAFFSLLRRFTDSPRILVATVDGRVVGGGVGLVAACDFVHVTDRASFSLSEALWGLLPCSVLPFLIRRVGFRKASAMTLSTLPVTAAEAVSCGLADERSDSADPFVRRLTARTARLNGWIVGEAKQYLSRLAPISEEAGRTAVAEFGRLMARPEVRAGIEGFAREGRFPWQR